MASERTSVFVSYSHADAPLVAPVVKLLRVNQSLVFQDVDDIQPGKRWRSEIDLGLAQCHLVVIFWCDHASQSAEVSKEWKAAIEQEKDLLPLLLDATPLPAALGEFQWIDFRATVGPHHSSIASPANDVGASTPGPAKSRQWLAIAGLGAVFVAIVALSLLTPHAPQAPPPVETPFPSYPDAMAPASKHILLLLALFVAVAACVARLLRRRWKRRRSIVGGKSQPRDVEQRIASEIETEILRRTALNRDAGA